MSPSIDRKPAVHWGDGSGGQLEEVDLEVAGEGTAVCKSELPGTTLPDTSEPRPGRRGQCVSLNYLAPRCQIPQSRSQAGRSGCGQRRATLAAATRTAASGLVDR